MNTLQVNGVLTKYVKCFQGVYPIDFLTFTLIKPSIIVISLDKHYMPGSHWVAVYFPTMDTPNILIRTVYNHTNLKAWPTYIVTQFL